MDNLSDEQIVNVLEEQLYQQVEFNRAYQIEKAMEVAQQLTPIVDYVKENKVLSRPEFAGKKKNIENLYKQLDMSINLAREEISQKLQQISTAKKTLGAYGSN